MCWPSLDSDGLVVTLFTAVVAGPQDSAGKEGPGHWGTWLQSGPGSAGPSHGPWPESLSDACSAGCSWRMQGRWGRFRPTLVPKEHVLNLNQ